MSAPVRKVMELAPAPRNGVHNPLFSVCIRKNQSSGLRLNEISSSVNVSSGSSSHWRLPGGGLEVSFSNSFSGIMSVFSEGFNQYTQMHDATQRLISYSCDLQRY